MSQFQVAVEIVQTLPKDSAVKPTQNEQLNFYGLYKQATVGDVNTTRPGLMDFAGKAKWDAWKANEGTAQDDAKKKYVELLQELLGKASDDAEIAKSIEKLNNA